MKPVIIAFDVDGCLRAANDKLGRPVADERIRTLLVTLHGMQNARIVIWSGAGELYAKQCAAEMHVAQYAWLICAKNDDIIPDITFDDEDVAMGTLNLLV